MSGAELTVGQIYFWVLAVLAIAGAVATVIAKNPIRGAMGLLGMILSLAGLFLALHAQFLAAIQLIVYAGAIVVLFLFVIMLLGPSATPPHDHRGRLSRTLGGALFAGAGLTAMTLLYRSAKAQPVAADAAEKLMAGTPPGFGTVDAFGKIIFEGALIPFELSSALLMVAIVGAVAVARGRSKHDVHEQLVEISNDPNRQNAPELEDAK